MAKRSTIKQQGQPAMRGVKAVEPYDDRPLNAGWVSASVVPGEDASSRYNNNTGRDFELVARARLGTPAMLTLIFAVFIACFILERMFPGWPLPQSLPWTLTASA